MNLSGPSLLRQISLSAAVALVVSNMVGTGIFTTPGLLARDLGDPKLYFAIWLCGGAIALIGAMCYSELGVNFPSSGGEYVFLTQAYGPVWGFMTGWTSFIAGFAAPVAATALAFAGYWGYFSPVFKPSNVYWRTGSGMLSLQIGGAQILACAVIGVFTIANIYGVQRAVALQKVLTGLKLVVIGIFVLLGLTVGTGSWDNFSLPTLRDSSVPIASQFAISLFYVYVSYSGWNAATYIAEEIRDPARNLPRALMVGTILVTVLFLLLNLVFVYAAPLGAMKGVETIGALASSRLFGSQMAGLFSALIAIALLAMVNAMVTVGPRVAYAMARNGGLLCRRCPGRSEVAHACPGHPHAGCRGDADDAYVVALSLLLHWFHVELLLGHERRLAVSVPETPRVEAPCTGVVPVAVAAHHLHPRWRLDDDFRRDT